jgi:hypothetical protein
MEKQKEYNQHYLLAKVRITRGKASDRLRQWAQTQQKPRRTSSDIGAEPKNYTVGRGSTQDRKGLKHFSCATVCNKTLILCSELTDFLNKISVSFL